MLLETTEHTTSECCCAAATPLPFPQFILQEEECVSSLNNLIILLRTKYISYIRTMMYYNTFRTMCVVFTFNNYYYCNFHFFSAAAVGYYFFSLYTAVFTHSWSTAAAKESVCVVFTLLMIFPISTRSPRWSSGSRQSYEFSFATLQ